MTKTNQYNQPTDAKGHVLKQTDLIATKLRTILFDCKDMDDYATAKELAAYVMVYAHTDWSKNVRHGVSLGRKDAIVMLKALADTNVQELYEDGSPFTIHAIPLTELQKVITALEETA